MKQYVAIYKTTGELVLVNSTILCSEVEFQVGDKVFLYLMAELGGQSNFEIIGDF
jgi:hypothetical protein